MRNQLVYVGMLDRDGRAAAGALVLPWERRGDFHRLWRRVAPRRPVWKKVKKKTLPRLKTLVKAFLDCSWVVFHWSAGDTGRDALVRALTELPRPTARRLLRLDGSEELRAFLERELLDETGAPLFADVRAITRRASPPLRLVSLLLSALSRRPKSRAKKRLSAHVAELVARRASSGATVASSPA